MKSVFMIRHPGTHEYRVFDGFKDAMELFEGHNVPLRVDVEPIEDSIKRVREYLGTQNQPGPGPT